MPSMPRGALRAMAGSGGGDRPKERWEPTKTPGRDSAIRIYRFEVPIDIEGVTSVEKQAFYSRKLHFNGKGKAPDDCSGAVSCPRCRKATLLEAQGTDAARDQARQMRPTDCPTFVVVPIDEPTRFRLYDARFSAFQGIVLEIAKAGGWKSPRYPEEKTWDDGSQIGQMFDQNFANGLDKVCGPNGQDLILSPTAKGMGTVWSVMRSTDGNQVLPFLEDSKVPNPEIVNARIKAAMARKAGGMSTKEGDE